MGGVQAGVHCCPGRLGLQVGSWLPVSAWVKNTYVDNNSFRELVLFTRGGRAFMLLGRGLWGKACVAIG